MTSVGQDIEAPPSTLTTGCNLLIVDDDEGVRASLSMLFRQHYQVLVAETGAKAIEIATANPIDVAICDLRMPGMTGIDLLGKLKDIDPATEVVMLTGYETLETARDALRLGACDYLSKDKSIDDMREVIARAMSRRAVSREIQNHDQRLSELQREIHDRQLREEIARTHSEIYASILHDINSPMTVVRGYVEKLRQELAAAKGMDLSVLAALRQHVNGIDHQITHCLDVSRRYLGFLEGRTQPDAPVPVMQVFAELKQLIAVHPNARHNEFEIHPLAHAHNVTPLIHATDFLSILLNLTINALQSSPEPHRVEVKARVVARIPDQEDGPAERYTPQPRPNREPALAVVVQDNGPGMTADVLDRAFQAHFTTKGGQGTGLGLSIVKRLVAQANGAIHLYSRPGEGAVFTVYLPAKF